MRRITYDSHRWQTVAMWFELLSGFREEAVDDVGAQFLVDGESLTSLVNGRSMHHGRFETVSLAELRARQTELDVRAGELTVREAVANVQQLHLDTSNAGALFQVASQFNTLEMVSPTVTPEDGIDRYEVDNTQGPACAVACGAGTIFRNYLVDVHGHRGQTEDDQINCLAPLAAALEVDIEMRNGYAFPTAAQLDTIAGRVAGASDQERDDLLACLQIGVQWQTEVTLGESGHLVTQAYCSALPVAYSSLPAGRWVPFARLVLDAAYEATFAAAVLNGHITGNRRLFLTLLGGGVFGNEPEWILDAIGRSVDLFANVELEVTVVSYRQHDPDVGRLLSSKPPGRSRGTTEASDRAR